LINKHKVVGYNKCNFPYIASWHSKRVVLAGASQSVDMCPERRQWRGVSVLLDIAFVRIIL
jgi:hypothetical protein